MFSFIVLAWKLGPAAGTYLVQDGVVFGGLITPFASLQRNVQVNPRTPHAFLVAMCMQEAIPLITFWKDCFGSILC